MKNKPSPLTLAEMLAYLKGELSPEAEAAMDARLAASPEDTAAMEALALELDEGAVDAAEVQAMEGEFLAALGGLEQAAPETKLETVADSDDPNSREAHSGSPAPNRSENEGDAGSVSTGSPGKAGGFRTWWAIAAAVLILAIPAVLLWPRAMRGEEAFQAYFEPYENVITARANGPIDTRIRLGLEAYDARLYEEAAAKFQERLAEDKTDLYANLYGGISLLAKGDPQAAIPLLSFVGNGANGLQMQGKWYLALAYLADGDKSLAEKHLDALAAAQGKYPDLARALLADL